MPNQMEAHKCRLELDHSEKRGRLGRSLIAIVRALYSNRRSIRLLNGRLARLAGEVSPNRQAGIIKALNTPRAAGDELT
jgi:hypothetical protein